MQSRMRTTWPFVVHALLDKFITDDLLRDERKVVTDARQKENEKVKEYARRLEEAADRCRHVFSQTELVHCFVVPGLHPSTRSLVHIQLGDDTDKADFGTRVPWSMDVTPGRNSGQVQSARRHGDTDQQLLPNVGRTP